MFARERIYVVPGSGSEILSIFPRLRRTISLAAKLSLSSAVDTSFVDATIPGVSMKVILCVPAKNVSHTLLGYGVVVSPDDVVRPLYTGRVD